MNRQEWDGVVAIITANWPHSLPPDESLDKWGSDLADQSAGEVLVAVEALYRDGREFPPNGAQILAKIGELQRSDPDPSEAWQIVNSVPSSISGHYDPAGWLGWVAERSEAVAEAARRFGVEQITGRDLSQETANRAQFRRTYEGVVEDRRRNFQMRGLTSAVRRLEGPQKADYVALAEGLREES